MRYFNYLTEEERKNIFFHPPEMIGKNCKKEMLAYALGAALYMPALQENISQNIIARKNPSIMSMILCMEDAIGDNNVNRAKEHLLLHLENLHTAVEREEISCEELPFIFIRVRSVEQFIELTSEAGESLKILTGFVFPKFLSNNARLYFDELIRLNERLGKKFYAMPILETPEIIYKETRTSEMEAVRVILDQYYDLVLNIRIGATDLCSQYGIRRGYDMTIYDISVIRDCIADIINIFARVDRGYVVSGPVWEYFHNGDRVLKPQLRQSPFEEVYGSKGIGIRKALLNKYLDGLIREVLLDKANGFVGKTIIHPTHITPIQALHVVSHEEYLDASSIINNNNGDIGVIKSEYQNKMNEIKPHLNWARKTMIKSKIYGVFNEKQNFTSLVTRTKLL